MHHLIKKVLFVTDLTDAAKHSFEYASAIATTYGAAIVILHITDRVSTSTKRQLVNLYGADQWEEIQRANRQAVRTVLIGKKQRHEASSRVSDAPLSGANTDWADQSPSRPSVIMSRQGNAAAQVLAVTAEEACDLIVISARPGLLGSPVLGRVVKDVLQRSEVPVLVVPPPTPA